MNSSIIWSRLPRWHPRKVSFHLEINLPLAMPPPRGGHLRWLFACGSPPPHVTIGRRLWTRRWMGEAAVRRSWLLSRPEVGHPLRHPRAVPVGWVSAFELALPPDSPGCWSRFRPPAGVLEGCRRKASVAGKSGVVQMSMFVLSQLPRRREEFGQLPTGVLTPRPRRHEAVASLRCLGE